MAEWLLILNLVIVVVNMIGRGLMPVDTAVEVLVVLGILVGLARAIGSGLGVTVLRTGATLLGLWSLALNYSNGNWEEAKAILAGVLTIALMVWVLHKMIFAVFGSSSGQK